MKKFSLITLIISILFMASSCGGDSTYIDEMGRSIEQIEWQMDRINSSLKQVKNNIPRDEYDNIKWFVEALEKSSGRIDSEVEDIISSENEAGNFSEAEVGDVRQIIEEISKDIEVFNSNTSQYLENKKEEQINPAYIDKLLREVGKYSAELNHLKTTLGKLKTV